MTTHRGKDAVFTTHPVALGVAITRDALCCACLAIIGSALLPWSYHSHWIFFVGCGQIGSLVYAFGHISPARLTVAETGVIVTHGRLFWSTSQTFSYAAFADVFLESTWVGRLAGYGDLQLPGNRTVVARNIANAATAASRVRIAALAYHRANARSRY